MNKDDVINYLKEVRNQIEHQCNSIYEWDHKKGLFEQYIKIWEVIEILKWRD